MALQAFLVDNAATQTEHEGEEAAELPAAGPLAPRPEPPLTLFDKQIGLYKQQATAINVLQGTRSLGWLKVDANPNPNSNSNPNPNPKPNPNPNPSPSPNPNPSPNLNPDVRARPRLWRCGSTSLCQRTGALRSMFLLTPLSPGPGSSSQHCLLTLGPPHTTLS